MPRSGKIQCNRFNISTTVTNINVPEEVSYFVIKNEGVNPVRFNFDSDAANDYWELKEGEVCLEIPISNANTVNLITTTGTSYIQMICWG